jgi:hypothetical protein
MTNPKLDERAGSRRIEDALDFIRLDEISRLAALVSSYWRSVDLAADRGDTLTVIKHCRQIAAVTRAAFELVKSLGQGPEEQSDPS